jgi:hypothetical protein
MLHQIEVYISHNNVRITNGSPKSHKNARKKQDKSWYFDCFEKKNVQK